ncbi:hypothetical protein CHUAL_000950 [Chamberlinius hualienensis]
MVLHYFLQFLITAFLVIVCRSQEFGLDPCYSNPCAVRAVCLSTNSVNYTCNCPEGFSGDGFTNCTDVCNPNPCPNEYLSCHSSKSVLGDYMCTCDPPNFNSTDGICCHDFCLSDHKGGSSILNQSFIDSNKLDSPTCTSHCTYATYSCSGNYISFQHPPSCIEFNICDPYNPCGNGTCKAENSTYKCQCFPGYVLNESGQCVDEDECETIFPCNHSSSGTICKNTIGGYTCLCDSKSSIGVIGNNSIPTCLATDMCNENANMCDQNCKNSFDGPICTCVAGYIWNDTICIFDESSSYAQCNKSCSISNETQTGVCLNGTCHCFSGYKLKNGICAPEYSCDDISNTCYHGFNCTNILTRPGYTCNCDSRHFATGLDGRCYDYDECVTGMHGCDDNATCINTDGDYICQCNVGFIGNGYNCTESSLNVCNDSEILMSCASMGKSCREKAPGIPDCYCPVPLALIGDDQLGYMCMPPAGNIYVYKLSLQVAGWTGENNFNTFRQLEYEFSKNFFPYVTSVPLLNIEVVRVISKQSESTEVEMHIVFSEDMSYLNKLLMEICSNYPYMKDTCILPANVLIRKSEEIKLSDITNSTVCDNPEFVCGRNGICEVLNHDYQCKCDAYHVPRGYVNIRRPICADKDECLEDPDICGSPTEVCVNTEGNYTCECLPCYVWDDTYNNCLFICQNNPCQNNGYCSPVVYDDICSYGCTCSENYFGPTCEFVNQDVHVARTDEAIIGGVLGGLLVVMIGISLLLVYKIQKHKRGCKSF